MKKVLLASTLALGLSASSCLGPNNTFNGINNWNANLSDQDWLNEIVYLAFSIVPVYGIALLLDGVVFNTIGYWTGDYVVKDPGPFPGFTMGSGDDAE